RRASSPMPASFCLPIPPARKKPMRKSQRCSPSDLPTIGRVRQRFVSEGLDAALNHRPQPPRPDKIKIKGGVEQELIRLACSDPPEGRCHWTLCLLADELVALGLVASVSPETVRQALKKNDI